MVDALLGKTNPEALCRFANSPTKTINIATTKLLNTGSNLRIAPIPEDICVPEDNNRCGKEILWKEAKSPSCWRWWEEASGEIG